MVEVKVTPLSEHVGADVSGVDLSQPLSDRDMATVVAALHEHGVIRLRGRRYDDGDVVRFSARFGHNKVHDLKDYLDKRHPELMLISNIEENGKPIGLKDLAILWHSDMSYTSNPNPISVLVAHEIPSWGGGTRFAGMAAAFAALPGDLQHRLRPALGVHSIRNYHYKPGQGMPDDMQAKYPEVRHPVVLVHPATGREALYVSEGTSLRIEGMQGDESRQILDFLFAHSVRPEFTWTQEWQVGDVVVWDNRSVIHQQTPYDPQQRRLLKRTTVSAVHPGI